MNNIATKVFDTTFSSKDTKTYNNFIILSEMAMLESEFELASSY